MTRGFHLSLANTAGFLAVTCCLGAVLLGGCSEPQRYNASRKSTLPDPQADFEKQRDRPPTARTLFALASIFGTQGKDQQCEFVLKRCILDYPEFMPAYNSLAELLMRQGRAGDAATVLSKALEISPADPVLLNNLGMCLMVHTEYDKALACFTEAAALLPQNRKYRANMAAALGLLGRHDESLSLMQQVLADQDAVHNAHVLREASEKARDPSRRTQG
jgi:Flp pilus assembly protein TadD